MSLGLRYTIQPGAAGVAMADAGVLCLLTAPADAALIIDRVEVTQENITASEGNAIRLIRASTAGTGGRSITPAPLSGGIPAAGSTALDDDTVWSAQPTLTATGMHRIAFNLLTGMLWHPSPSERIEISPSGRLAVEIENAPAGAVTWSYIVSFREIGG